MRAFYGDLKLGILGGGQLGRMLIQEAINYNVTTHVLDPDKDAPCKNFCDNFVTGSLTDFQTVYAFGKGLDLITIEIEKVNVDALEKLETEGVVVYPQSRVIRLIQDKGLQKQFFKENHIPTAPFRLISKREDLSSAGFQFPYFQKLRKDGYDGRGVYRINSAADFDKAFEEPSIIEEFEMEFNPQVNLVEFLISPSTLSSDLLQKADHLAVKIATDLKIVGVLAVEMFLTKTGEILVNELAPRPHNSGHHSIEGNITSQYDQHLRAIFNLPLGDTRSISNAVMINLLGERGYEGLADYEGLDEVMKISGVYIHLYGKKVTKPYRKMGHVTVIDDDRGKAIEKARLVQEIIKVKV
jgi:5-(carboxyamino)imidazole ribonucleotide synthase